MTRLELGRVLVKLESSHRTLVGSSCFIRKDGPLHKLLIGDEVVFSCKERNERGVWAGSIIEALNSAIAAGGIGYFGTLLEESLVQFSLNLDTQPLQDHGQWVGGRKVAHLFSNLIPATDNLLYEPVHCDPIKQLSSYKVADLLPLLKTVDETLADVEDNCAHPKSWIENLPDDVLYNIFACCDPKTFRSLQCCSKTLYNVSRESIPSIRTELCEHQRKSLKWMIWREQEGRQMKHLCKQFVQTTWGPLEINEVDSSFKFVDKEEEFEDIRGGILADEPGLGKTATILSLVMRTRGVLASAPEKSERFVQPGPDGHLIGWYWFEECSGSIENDSRLRRVRFGDHHHLKFLTSTPSLMDSMELQAEEVGTPCPKRPRTRSSVKDSDITSGDMEWSLDSPNGKDKMKTVIEQWVCCDYCNTWKVIPSDYKVGLSRKWFCHMHPDKRQTHCGRESKRNSIEDSDVVVCGQSGYISADTGKPSMDNFTYFSYILDEFRYAFFRPMNAVSVLCSFRHEELHAGFTIMPEYQYPENYGRIFTKLGLIKCISKKRERDEDGGGECWKIPESHGHLNLDTFVLSAVVSSYLGQDDQRIYLSQATLIVVPFTLIEQWKEEITKHFHGNHLRVCVLTRRFHYPKRICRLAWDYDVVLTSFTHLSNQQSEHLLRIHWLRVVLDEGHLIGTSPSRTTRKDRIFALRAERRWIITGTPTPDVAHRSTVNNLYPLIQFLKIKPFSTSRHLWDTAIQKPFEAKLPEGRRRLQTLLNTLMIRTFKTNINSLVKINKAIITLEFEPAHAASYNELVEVVKRNLLLADFGEDGHEESLLNRSNTKWASEMFKNVNLSCCVAGNCFLEVNDLHLLDTLRKLALRNGYSMEFLDGRPWWTASHHPLREIEQALRFGGTCMLCFDRVRLPLVTPCVHLLCENCVQKSRESCSVCHVPYLMQCAQDPARHLHNSNPKLPVPIELIEWQPSYAQAGAVGRSGGGWNPDWRATQSSKCKQLVKRLFEINVMDVSNGNAKKAIIFSRFWPHINLIDKSLDDASIPHCVLKRDLSPIGKKSAIHSFRSNEQCNVLLMDITGAVGLDLSMASWVFLMEPLLDRSIEDQIVSRAYRMGAKENIHVEVMIMKRSVEELVLNSFMGTESDRIFLDKTELKEDNIKIRNQLINGLRRVTKST